MKLVEPTTRTTLLLNRHFMAFSFCTARAAMRHLVTGRIKGMDADGNIMSWDGSDLDTYPTANTLSWESGNITLFNEHPYLRSAPNPITGKESRKFIPQLQYVAIISVFTRARKKVSQLKPYTLPIRVFVSIA